MFGLIATSGFPFFFGDPYLVFLFLFALLIFLKRNLKVEPVIFIYLIIISYILVGQTIYFKYISIVTTLGLYIRILIAYLIIRILNLDFINYFIRQIYTFTIISFVFYGVMLLFPPAELFLIQKIAPLFDFYFYETTTLYKSSPQIIIYCFNTGRGAFYNFIRNSGPFWEASAFSGFLILALTLNLMQGEKIFQKTNVVFIIAVITTFSTTGYIALPLLLTLHFLSNSKLRYKMFLVPLVVFLGFYFFFQLDFMENKIQQELRMLGRGDYEYQSRTRLISAMVDFEDIKEYPFFGRGRNVNTRFDYSDEILRHRNNGVTGYFVEFGIIGGLLLFLLILNSYKSIVKVGGTSKVFAYYSFFVLILIGMSQQYFVKPLFMALPFIFINYKIRGILNGSLIKANSTSQVKKTVDYVKPIQFKENAG